MSDESVNDAILERLDKGHTAADASRAVALLRGHGIEIRPSFLPFTPWTTHADIVELLDFVYDHDLVGIGVIPLPEKVINPKDPKAINFDSRRNTVQDNSIVVRTRN